RRCERTVDLVRILRAITLIEGSHRGARLLHGESGLQPPHYAEKAGSAHHPLVGESGKVERFVRPNFGDRIRSKPACRHIGKNADDGMSHTIECDAAADYIGITAEPFLPEILGDERYIRTLFFLRQKIASANRPNSQNIKVIGCQSAAKDLDRVSQPGQGKGKEIFSSQIVENSLAVSKMLIAGRVYPDGHE